MTRNRPNRRSIRLKGYDYTQPGAYFITICTHHRVHLFGAVVDGEMQLNALGEVAYQCWLAIPDHFPHAALDEFVIMPNHVHGILWIVERPPTIVAVGANHDSPTDRRGEKPLAGVKNDSPPTPTTTVVGAKDFSPLPSSLPSPLPSLSPSRVAPRPHGTSKTIGSMIRGFKIGVTKWARQNTDIYAVWQRNYYEHIIRNDRALNAIRQYIAGNPARWHLDRYNDDAVGRDPRAVEIWRMLQTSRLESRDKSSNGG